MADIKRGSSRAVSAAYIRALGGRLEIVADFGGERLVIANRCRGEPCLASRYQTRAQVAVLWLRVTVSVAATSANPGSVRFAIAVVSRPITLAGDNAPGSVRQLGELLQVREMLKS
jgi:hypothetical protein